MVDSYARINLEDLEGCNDGNRVSARIHQGLASLCIKPVKTQLATIRTLVRGILNVRLNLRVAQFWCRSSQANSALVEKGWLQNWGPFFGA